MYARCTSIPKAFIRVFSCEVEPSVADEMGRLSHSLLDVLSHHDADTNGTVSGWMDKASLLEQVSC